MPVFGPGGEVVAAIELPVADLGHELQPMMAALAIAVPQPVPRTRRRLARGSPAACRIPQPRCRRGTRHRDPRSPGVTGWPRP